MSKHYPNNLLCFENGLYPSSSRVCDLFKKCGIMGAGEHTSPDTSAFPLSLRRKDILDRLAKVMQKVILKSPRRGECP